MGQTKKGVNNTTVKTVKETVNELISLNELIAVCEKEERLLTMQDRTKISVAEVGQFMNLFTNQQNDKNEAEVKQAKQKAREITFKGADLIALQIYLNSVNNEFTDNRKLWKFSQKGVKKHLKTFAAFTRSFDSKKEGTLETYFENIAERINGLKGSTTESTYFKQYFADVERNTTASSPLKYVISMNSISTPCENTPTYQKSHFNKLFIKGYCLEVVKAWLLYKGATEEMLTSEAEFNTVATW